MGNENAARMIAHAITPVGVLPGRDASGESVASLTEAVMGITAGLMAIATSLDGISASIDNLADAIQEAE